MSTNRRAVKAALNPLIAITLALVISHPAHGEPTSTGTKRVGPAAQSVPTGLTATPGNMRVGLSWKSKYGATSYDIYRGMTPGGETNVPIATGIDGTTFTDTGVTNGVTYFYNTSSITGHGASSASDEASATPTSGAGSTTNAFIDCGGDEASGWSADTGYYGGRSSLVYNAIDMSGDLRPAPTQAVMQSERDGSATYTITGMTPGSHHIVSLYFSENHFNGANMRRFNVSIQESMVLSNFDVFATAGAGNKAIEQSFSATTDSSGSITISLMTILYSAEINGIAVQ